MKLALATSALLLVVASAAVPPPDVCQAADGHGCTTGEDEDDGNMALQVHKDVAKEFDQAAIVNGRIRADRSIADEYTVSYEIQNALSFQSREFMDEMEKQEIIAQTGFPLDTFFANMGAPTVTITDAEGNVLHTKAEGGDHPDHASYPMQLTLVFKKVSSPGLALAQIGSGEKPFAKDDDLRTRWDLADRSYHESTIYGENTTDGVFIQGCKFAFKGSDSPTSGFWDDWTNNIRGFFSSSRNVNGYQIHDGFYAEFESVRKQGLDGRVKDCENDPELEFIGHSLGGAMAYIARVYYGKGKVTTFCAPRVFKTGTGCPAIEGRRIFHEEDPVSGPVFGITNGYEHGQGGTRLGYKCAQYKDVCYWWFCYSSCSQWATRGTAASCTEGSHWWAWNVMTYHMFDFWWGLFSNPVHRH